MENKNNNSKLGIIIIVIVIFLFIGLFSGGGSSGSSSKTCQVCHRTFESSSEKSNIARTNMCKNCYSNYKWSMDAQGKDLLGNPK